MHKAVHLFVGPTLRAPVRELGVHVHGPAAQGDIYRVALQRPLAIGIVDGYFERQPAVWHKEILFALSQGILVLGAASMGALRAAELTAFGMRGVGAIYHRFASGELTDDDEVTVSHAGADEDYKATSQAMVNIRATLEKARAVSIISSDTESLLIDYFKSLWYPDRHLAVLQSRTPPPQRKRFGSRLPARPVGPEVEALAKWWRQPGHFVDAKQEDAIALLEMLAALHTQPIPSLSEGPWTFHRTDAWEQVRLAMLQPATNAAEPNGPAGTESANHFSEERTLKARSELELRTERRVALATLGKHLGLSPDAYRSRVMQRFMHEHELNTERDVSTWLSERNLTGPMLTQRLAEEALAECTAEVLQARSDDALQATLDLLPTPKL